MTDHFQQFTISLNLMSTIIKTHNAPVFLARSPTKLCRKLASSSTILRRKEGRKNRKEKHQSYKWRTPAEVVGILRRKPIQRIRVLFMGITLLSFRVRTRLIHDKLLSDPNRFHRALNHAFGCVIACQSERMQTCMVE